ncbi:MAG: hypothetical protein ACI9NY_001681, partial [Kiritimatiellia bacterium]
NAYKAVMKKFKHWNKKLYTATKLTLLAIVFYGIGSLLV